MFSPRPPPYALYSRLMRSGDRGEAMWDPSPDVTSDERGERREDPIVQVGHVGYRQEGKWRHVLDVHRQWYEQHSPELVPQGFQVLPRRPISSHEPEGPIHFTPRSRTSFAIETSVSSGGGVSASGPSLRFSLDCEASLTYFGRSQRDQVRKIDLGKYKEYAVQNLKYWSELVASNGWSLDVNELSIVTDRTLAPSWVNSVQSEKTTGAQVGAQIYVNGTAGGGFSVSFLSTSSIGLVTKYGPFSRLSALPPPAEPNSARYCPPRDDDPAIAGPLDQCLFIKSVRAADRSLLERSLSRLSPVAFGTRRASRDQMRGSSSGTYSLSANQGSSLASQGAFEGGSSGIPFTDCHVIQELASDDECSSPDWDTEYDPAVHALQYILQESSADIAVYHDDDIQSHLAEGSFSDDISRIFLRSKPRIFIHDYDGQLIGSLTELDFGTPVHLGPSTEAKPVTHPLLKGKEPADTSGSTSALLSIQNSESSIQALRCAEEVAEEGLELGESRLPEASPLPLLLTMKEALEKVLSPSHLLLQAKRLPPPVMKQDKPEGFRDALDYTTPIARSSALEPAYMPLALATLSSLSSSKIDGRPRAQKRVRTKDEDAGTKFSGAKRISQASMDPPKRLPGACTYCRRLKMKCEFPPGASRCKRCSSGNHSCVVEGRRPLHAAPSKREYLLAQLRQKDAIIESLLKQLHSSSSKQFASTAPQATPSESAKADQRHQDIVAWLDQLQESLHDPTSDFSGAPGPSAHLLTDANRDKKAVYDGSGAYDEDLRLMLPDTVSPLGLLAGLSFKQRELNRPRMHSPVEDDFDSEPVGVANADYFVPGPSVDFEKRFNLTETLNAPDLIVHGIIEPTEVENLFEIFHNCINVFTNVLDRRIHTPQRTLSRSPLLFTTVCALALRYSDRPSQFHLAMHFAKSEAAMALVDGQKSAELAQVYALLSMYSMPSQRFEEDRSMLYARIADCIMLDLNIAVAAKKPPRNKEEALEVANYKRLLMTGFTLNMQSAAAFGKPAYSSGAFASREIFEEFSNTGPDDSPSDVHLAAKSILMLDLARFYNEILSQRTKSAAPYTDFGLREMVLRHDAVIMHRSDEWTRLFQRQSHLSNETTSFRCKLFSFYVGWSRLVILSFALHQTTTNGSHHRDEFFLDLCYSAAFSVITTALDLVIPAGYLRCAPDLYFMFSAFASGTLLKLLDQQDVHADREREVYASINCLITLFRSPAIAVDNQHTPYLYADFLERLLAQHRDNTGSTMDSYQSGAGSGYSSPFATRRGTSPAPSAMTFASTASSAAYPTPPPPLEYSELPLRAAVHDPDVAMAADDVTHLSSIPELPREIPGGSLGDSDTKPFDGRSIHLPGFRWAH